MGKILTYLTLSTTVALGGAIAAEYALPERSRPSALAANMKVIKKRIENPLVSEKELRKTFEETPKDLSGFIDTMKSLEQTKSAPSATNRQAHAALEALENPDGSAASDEAESASHMITIRDYVSPNAIEHIENLNAPESVKQAILENYRRTGILPTSIEQQDREPASEGN